MSLTSFWLLCAVLSLNSAHGKIFYVLPFLNVTTATICPEKDIPCLTLSQYARKPTNYFPSNTTFILLPGYHELDENLTLREFSYLNIKPHTQYKGSSVFFDQHTSKELPVVECTKGVHFSVVDVDTVHISGLTVIGCGQYQYLSLQIFTLTGSHFIGNEYNSDGMLLWNVENATITNSSFIANSGSSAPFNSHRGGAIVAANNTFVSIMNCVFQDNAATVLLDDTIPSSGSDVGFGIGLGGALYLHHSIVHVKNTTFFNNSASDFGGALYSFESNVTLENCVMDYNSAYHGGTLYIDVESSIKIEYSVFVNSQAYYGGVMEYSTNDKITVHASVFYNNTAVSGGVILCAPPANNSLEITNSVFNGNLGLSAAGVMLVSSINLTVRNSFFQYNEAKYQSGGVIIAAEGTILRILNCTFDNNMAAQTGGAIGATESSSVLIHNSSFQYNTAQSAGAVAASHGTILIINGSTFCYNVATESSGVIGGSFGLTAKIYNSTFFYNSARETGVIAVTVNGSVEIYNSHFEFNRALNISGVIFAQLNDSINVVSSTFNNNSAWLGGVLYAKDTINVNMDNSTFSNNVASEGGVMFTFQNVMVTIYNSCFMYNEATTDTGGVIAALNRVIIAVNNSQFKYNTADEGGVIFADDIIPITVSHSLFQCNRAVNGSGGVISIQFNIALSLPTKLQLVQNQTSRSCSIRIYSSTFQNNSADSGGCIVLSRHTCIALYDSKFDHNKAAGFGGVLYGIDSFFYNLSEWIENRFSVINSAKMTIHNCSFQHNTAFVSGGVIAHTNRDLEINLCFFYNNSAQQGGVIEVDYSGLCNCSVYILNTTMDSNNAYKYGGAIMCAVVPPGDYFHGMFLENITISNTDSASGFGGAMYSDKCNLTSNGLLHIHDSGNENTTGIVYIFQSTAIFNGNTIISDNIGSIFAVESTLTFVGVAAFMNGNSLLQNIKFINGVFYPEAGVLMLSNSVLNLLGKTIIMNNQAFNGGALIATDSTIYMSGDITIFNNTALSSGGFMYAYQSDVSFTGDSVVKQNSAKQSGGAVHAIGSTIKFKGGAHHFIENSATANGSGGALFLEMNSQLHIVKSIKEDYNCSPDYVLCVENSTLWLRLEFIHNSAHYGGAIFVNDGANTDVCTGHTYSPTAECFFQVLQLYFSETTFPDTPIKNTLFHNNTASVAGNNLYGGLLDRCIFNPFLEHYSNVKHFAPLFTYDLSKITALTHNDYTPSQYLQKVTNIDLDSISSLPLRICFCDENRRPNCSYQPPLPEVFKGQSFNLWAVTVDQVNHTLPGTVHCLLSSKSGGLAEGETRQDTLEECTQLTYTILSPRSSEELICYVDQGPCKELGISKQLLEVHFSHCPIGFKLLPTSNSICKCDPDLKPYVINCSISTATVVRQGEFWISPTSYNDSTVLIRYIVYPHCPLDYCRSPVEPLFINLNSSDGVDQQCSFNRSGKLCGKCKPGFSLILGGNHCKICSNYWLLLFIPFALAGIALVTFILILNFTVAVGTINGIVFYANIIAINHSIYFPFENPNFFTVFISWLNLDFGFQTCLCDGMDAYIKTWLQFLFPLYIIFLVVAIIIISDYSRWFASLLAGKNPVATLATLILLSYTKLLRTVIAALSFARLSQLPHQNGSNEIVWLLDASVPYLQGKHIPLFIVAIVITLMGLAYTIVLFSWQLLIRCPRQLLIFKWTTNSKLLSFIDAYHAPYKHQHRYWIGMLFVLRTILYLIFAVNVLGDPRVNLVAIICVMLSLFMYSTIIQQPYKVFLLNILDNAHYFNLSMFSALTFYCKDTHGNQTALAYTSVSITTILCLTTVIYHSYTYILLKKKDKIMFLFKMCGTRKKQETRHQLLTDETELPNVANFDNHLEVSVTEVNAVPSIHSTITNNGDEVASTLPVYVEHSDESDCLDSSEDDESAPLLAAYLS